MRWLERIHEKHADIQRKVLVVKSFIALIAILLLLALLPGVVW